MRIDLSTEHGGNIAASVRGPDHKWIYWTKVVLTGRIRHRVGYTGGIVRDRPITGVMMNGMCQEIFDMFLHPESYRCMEHYLSHVDYGAKSLASLDRGVRREMLTISEIAMLMYFASNYHYDYDERYKYALTACLRIADLKEIEKESK